MSVGDQHNCRLAKWRWANWRGTIENMLALHYFPFLRGGSTLSESGFKVQISVWVIAKFKITNDKTKQSIRSLLFIASHGDHLGPLGGEYCGKTIAGLQFDWFGF